MSAEKSLPPINPNEPPATRALRQIIGRLDSMQDMLATLRMDAEAALNEAITGLPTPDKGEPLIPNRVHHHRLGGGATLDKDAEQADFVSARFGHMTFVEIAEAAAEYFGDNRAVSKTTINKWYNDNFK